MNLSKYQKLRIAVQVVELCKELPNKDIFYIHFNRCEKDLNQAIAKKAGIHISHHTMESGYVDIDEYITLTRDELEMRLYREIKNQKTPKQQHNLHGREWKEFPVSEQLKELTIKFEKENIPESGPCKTRIGEMFRAIQRIQYRRYNDGDEWFIIGSDSFMSYMYLVSMVDELNWSSDNWNEEIGKHFFEFTDPFLKENSWEGRINDIIEDSLARDAEFIKYQLVDLLSNEKLKDIPNGYDSRNFSKLKTESRY